MATEPDDSIHTLVRRIFLVQILMILATVILVYVAIYVDLGFFWFAFLAGTFGASVSLLRRVQKGDVELARGAVRGWGATLMPFLYGGVMAGLTYFLFISEILSGKEGNGLLATNLFPDFKGGESGKRLAVKDWLVLRPKELHDAGKLIVWSFVAGFSESFVIGILQGLERKSGQE